ncbi:hypothetical protein AAMO2058_001729800, partial [Amorphochlora amoebiformis]
VLGFDEKAQASPLNSLSGGLRMRVALCAAFFLKADLLLLDEPTNHLDFPTILWLEHKLRSYDGGFILVTHDKHLLENVCQAVIVLEEKKLKYYMCPYKQFVTKKAAEDKKRYEENHKFLVRYQGHSSLGVSLLGRQIQEKDDWCREYVNRQVRIGSKFTFPEPRKLPLPPNWEDESKPFPIQTLENVRFAYDHKKNFIFDEPINVTIMSNTRLGVMGPNGAGKSTLLKLLNERIKPTSGIFRKHPDFDVAYFGQHSAEELDLEMTPIEWMQEQFPNEREAVLRNHMKRVGCVGEKQDSRMKGFSGGQKACVIFSKLTYRCPHLLVLDEPTNFLDMESVDSLILACNKYKGALMVVTHSRHFLEGCCKQFLSITPGRFAYHKTLKACEKDTYDFIARLEQGKSVRIKKVSTGAGQLAEQKERAAAEEASKLANDTASDTIGNLTEAMGDLATGDQAPEEEDLKAEASSQSPKAGMQVQLDFNPDELLDAPDLQMNVTEAERQLELENIEDLEGEGGGGKEKKDKKKKSGKKKK